MAKWNAPDQGYHHLVENMPNGVLVLFDADLRYRIVGPETLPFSERSSAGLVGKTIYELFPEENIAELETELIATLEGESRSIDTQYEGRVHHIETKPIEIDGDPYGVLITQDVTEERQTAEKLRESNESLDQFSSMVSHDLRNHLSVLSGKLSLYRDNGDETLLDDVERSIGRINELAEDLLALARLESYSNEHEPLSLEKITKSSWEQIDSKDATLMTEEATVVGSESQLRTLFENLFRNAVGHGGSDVTVRVGPLGDGFYVEDTGEGISQENREEMFEHGHTTTYAGTGIGLTIVERIATAHGWDIRVTDSPEGGARFEFQPIEVAEDDE